MAAAHDPDMARIDIGTMLAEVWRRKWRIAAVSILLLALTYVALMFVPKMYESSASLLVESRDTTFLRAGNDTSSSGGGVSDDMAIASQVELIQSRDTLLQVIDALDLRDVAELNTASQGVVGTVLGLFGRAPKPPSDVTAVVLGNMDKRLTVIRERDSRVISILFRSESPQLAARIANAIANAHVNRRAGLELSDTADASKWLETEIAKMRRKVAEADAAVANFRIANDLYNGTDGTSSLIDQQLSDMATQITESQQRESTARSRAEVLRGLIRQGKPIDSVPALQDSAVIGALAQQKSELQGKKAELLARLLSNHPEVRAVTAQIAEIDTQMSAEGARIADALDAEADIEAGIQSSLRDKLTQLKATASTDLTNGVSLAELEREAKAQRDLLETYLVRYRDASARTDVNSALPDVRVVTAAAPSITPASPKSSLILAAVLVVSLAGQIGYILFAELASGRAIIAGRDDWEDVETEPSEIEPVEVAPAVAAAADEEPEPGTLEDVRAGLIELEDDVMDEHPMPEPVTDIHVQPPRAPRAEVAPVDVAAIDDVVFVDTGKSDGRPDSDPVTETESETPVAAASSHKVVSRFADLLRRVPRAAPPPQQDELLPEETSEEQSIDLSRPMTGPAAALDPLASSPDAEAEAEAEAAAPEPESPATPEVQPQTRSRWTPPADWEARMKAAGLKDALSVAPPVPQDATDASPSDSEATEVPKSPTAMPAAAASQPTATPPVSEPAAPQTAQKPATEPRPAAPQPSAAKPAIRQPAKAPPSSSSRPLRLPDKLKPLVNAISSGREQVVLVSGLGDPAFANGIIEQLGATCAALGLGVASIDAASGRTGTSPGLSDLLSGAASFGDVVHADLGGHMARVPWGRRDKLDARSSQGLTLAEALSDIYNVVLISTGLPGPGSSLPVFAGLKGTIVLASALPVDDAAMAGFEAGAGALGFKRVMLVSAADADAQVA